VTTSWFNSGRRSAWTFARCVGAGRYLDWVAYVSDAAIKRGVSGTPTTLVNGVPVPANANSIAAAVAAFADS
jgi:hypothetical protein